VGVRQNLEKKIEQKRLEIVELEAKLREMHAFIQGMQEALKVLPRDAVAGAPAQSLRAGSDMANARDYLARIGRPAHISEIMEELNKDGSETRQSTSVSSSLASYARKGEIFKRTAPNTFALIDPIGAIYEEKAELSEPPDNFGTDEPEVATVADDDIPF